MHTESLLITGSELQTRLKESESQYADVSATSTTALPNIPLLVAMGTAFLFALTIGWSLVAKKQRPAGTAVRNLPERRVAGVRLTAVGGVCITIGYAFVLSLGWPGYLWATVAYLVAIGMVLTRASRRLLPLVAVASVIISLTVFWVFTRQFDVGLP